MVLIKIDPNRVAFYVQGPTAEDSYLNVLEIKNKKAYKWTRGKDEF